MSSRTLTGLRNRLEPHHGHERVLAQSAGACRWLWNWALAYREDLWLAARSAGATGLLGSAGYNHLSSLLTGLKERHPWLALAPHHSLQATLRDLDAAFAAFFEGRQGYPQYHRKGDHDSIRFPDRKQFVVAGDWVKLPKLGWMRFRLSRPITGEVRNIAISREGGHWFISFCVHGAFTLPNAGQECVGLDLGVTQSVTASTGEVIQLPVATDSETRRLKFLQRQAARRAKGSGRRGRSNERIAKLKRHIANRRRDAAHKLSTRLATTHTIIVIEDLKIRNMTASAAGTAAVPGRNVRAKAGLNRGMLANGHSDFRRMLTYKCERSGADLRAINPALTSQTCSQCKHCAPENRKSQAVFLCVVCEFTCNADLNAALNIKAAGLAVSAQGGSEVTPARELRTHPRARKRKLPGSTGIPVKTAAAV